MKKVIIASILGIAATAAVTTSYAQGSMIFGNYSFGSANYSAPVSVMGSGLAVDSSFSAQLMYSTTAGGTYTAVGSPVAFFGSSLGDTAGGAGLWQAEGVTVPSYTTGTAYFEVYVWNTATVNGMAPGGIVGTSAVFSYSTLATAANLHTAGLPFSGINGDVLTSITAFSVAPVPEPTTLALAGLGGLASLVAFRRKQS